MTKGSSTSADERHRRPTSATLRRSLAAQPNGRRSGRCGENLRLCLSADQNVADICHSVGWCSVDLAIWCSAELTAKPARDSNSGFGISSPAKFNHSLQQHRRRRLNWFPLQRSEISLFLFYPLRRPHDLPILLLPAFFTTLTPDLALLPRRIGSDLASYLSQRIALPTHTQFSSWPTTTTPL